MSGSAAGSHPRSKPDACSVIWDRAEASALGTAPTATFWVALEQSGPWGREAATQSHLDPGVGSALDRSAKDVGGRVILLRRPGTHSNAHQNRPHRVYVAGGLADRPWLLEADLTDPASLLRLPWAALRDGDMGTVRASLPELHGSRGPVLMVCSNSKRDVCCAVRGRPVALGSSAQRPGQVWECSHTGGHRFAPTGILLPYGQTLARLSVASAVALVDAAAGGELPVELVGAAYDRGRSHLAPPAQAAESTVRQQVREPNLLAFTTTAEPHPSLATPWHVYLSPFYGRYLGFFARRWPAAPARPAASRPQSWPTLPWVGPPH